MCSATPTRTTSTREAIPHLPAAVANELTELGWPAEATRVLVDSSRIFPAPRYLAERLKEEARAQRYRRGPSRQRYLASQRRQNELSGLVKQ